MKVRNDVDIHLYWLLTRALEGREWAASRRGRFISGQTEPSPND